MNNSLLDKFFQDTQSNNNDQKRNIIPLKASEDLLKEFFDESLQSKTNNQGNSLIIKRNQLDDSILKPKSSENKQNNEHNDIFQFLDDQSDFEDNGSYRFSQAKQESIVDKDNQKKNNFLSDDNMFKKETNKDLNFDLDNMLLELNKNIEQSSNNLRNYKDNLVDNTKIGIDTSRTKNGLDNCLRVHETNDQDNKKNTSFNVIKQYDNFLDKIKRNFEKNMILRKEISQKDVIFKVNLQTRYLYIIFNF